MIFSLFLLESFIIFGDLIKVILKAKSDNIRTVDTCN